MTDPSLRLPTSTLRVVLDLGRLPLDIPQLPPHLSKPDLGADWDEETSSLVTTLDYADGQFHFEVSEDGTGYHFHDGGWELCEASPWSVEDTETLVVWTARVGMRLLEVLPEVIHDAVEAAEWHAHGLPVYTRQHDPVPLEILDVEIEGELMMLPWLGAGHVGHEHIDGPNHPIVLLWNPEHEEPDQVIAEAWLDPVTEEPASKAVAGVDWSAVGLSEAEVLAWVEGMYLNHHVIEDPVQAIIRAAVYRIAGLDPAKA